MDFPIARLLRDMFGRGFNPDQMATQLVITRNMERDVAETYVSVTWYEMTGLLPRFKLGYTPQRAD